MSEWKIVKLGGNLPSKVKSLGGTEMKKAVKSQQVVDQLEQRNRRRN